MNFKMSKLKPHLCRWIYKAWINVSSKTNMINKRWAQTILLRAFDNDFQKQVMLDNMIDHCLIVAKLKYMHVTQNVMRTSTLKSF